MLSGRVVYLVFGSDYRRARRQLHNRQAQRPWLIHVSTRGELLNQRGEVAALRRELGLAKRQNRALRALALHGPECAICRWCVCPVRERLFRRAFSRQLQTWRTP
jgi:hypothetical protein